LRLGGEEEKVGEIKKKDNSTRSCGRKSGKTGEIVYRVRVALGVGFLKLSCAIEGIWKSQL
jgi:hypothetical protein